TAINLFFTGVTAPANQMRISGLKAEVTKIYYRMVNLETTNKESGARISVSENDRLTFLRVLEDASTGIFTVEEHYETLKQKLEKNDFKLDSLIRQFANLALRFGNFVTGKINK
ncbi:unnamed protein product, partial [Didymodactylos carnosus]